MAEKRATMNQRQSIGDAAVDGLLAGLVAGLLMAILLILMSLVSNFSPTATLNALDPRRAGDWLSGLLAHLAISAIYGLIFALLVHGAQRLLYLRALPKRRVLAKLRPLLKLGALRLLAGLIYGLALFVVAQGAVLTALAAPMPIADWQWAAAHAVYGLGLGVWLDHKY